MKIFGLTGSIGMGKSLVAALLRGRRLPVFDSDKAVHTLLSPKGAAFQSVARAFPAAWDAKNHVIDRQKLGAIVFADPVARRHLESLLHPLVDQMQKRFVLKARRMGARHVILDIPLLYETRGDKKCDAVICATAPFFVQRLRVLNRPGMNAQKFQAVLSQQLPDHEKRRRADATIPTGLGRAFSIRALQRLLHQMKVK